MDIFGITGARDMLTDAVFWLCVSWCVCVCFWEALETQQDSIWKPREASDLLYPNIIKT